MRDAIESIVSIESLPSIATIEKENMKRKLMMMVLFGLSSTSLLAQRSETNLRQWQF
jgi:hypothetical protein